MSSDTSMVSSAADCCGKPQPIRSVGNTHSSHRERKESKMFINGLSSSRGLSLATAAWVTGYRLRVTAAWARVIRATKQGISRPRERGHPGVSDAWRAISGCSPAQLFCCSLLYPPKGGLGRL